MATDNGKGSGLTSGLNKKDQKLFSEWLKSQTKSKEDLLAISKEEQLQMSKVADLQQRIALKEAEILHLTETRLKSASKMKDLQDKIKKAVDEQADTEKDLFTSNKLVLLKKKKIAELEKESGDANEFLLALLKKEVKEEEKRQKSLEVQLYQIDEYISSTEELVDLERDKTKELSVQVNQRKIGLGILETELSAAEANLKKAQEHTEALHKATHAAEELVEKYEEVLEPFEEIDAWMKKIPGGGLMSKALGLDGIGDKIKKQIVEKIASGQVAGKGLVASLGPLLPLLVAAGLLMKAFEFDKELTQFSKDLDVSKGSALEASNHADHLATHLGMANITGKEMGASMVALKEEFGDAVLKNDKLVEGVTMLRDRMGLTNEEAISLNATATLLGTNLDELSASSMKMSKGLIGGKQMLKEMSKLPKSILAGFKGTTKELQKAVVKGKLLGLELSKVQSIGDGILDIESSIEKEMTANVLTGKHMNLNRARQLSLTGQTAELQQELLDQAGGLEEYQKMFPYQQRAYAEAMEMTRDEMTEMLVKAQELKDVGLDQTKIEEVLAKNGAERDKMMSGMNAKQQGYLQKLIEQQNREEATAKFQTAMNRLMEAFSKSMLPVVDLLGEILGYIGNIVDYLTKGVEYVNHFVHELSGATEPLKEGEGIMSKILKYTIQIGAAMLAWNVGKKALGGLKSMIPGMGGGKATEAAGAVGEAGSKDVGNAKSMADKLNGIAKSVTAFFDILRNAVKGIMGIITDVFKGVGEALAGFFKAFSSISFTDLIKGALALGIMGGALWVVGEALQKFADIGLDDLGIAALALIGLTAAVVGLGMILPLILAGSLALGVMSAAFWVFGMAAASVADSMPALASGFKLFGDIDGGNLIGVAAGIGALSLALAAFGGGSAISGIGSALGSLFDEDPIEKFNRFAAIDSTKLIEVAGAIDKLGSAIAKFSGEVGKIGDVSGIVSTIDKVMELHDAITKNPISEAIEGVGNAVGDIFSKAASFITSTPTADTVNTSGVAASTDNTPAATGKGSLADVAKLLKELIAKVDQPVKININGRIIDEIEKQTTLRKTYSTKVDGGYGTFG
jgi:hypothetical protein